MSASFCTTSSGQSLGLQETWLHASALDWPTTLLSPRKSFCSTDVTMKLPTQRIMSGREVEEPRKCILSQTPPFHAEKLCITIPRIKNLLNNILCSYPIPHNITTCLTEADVTLCSYMLKAVAEGAQTIRILSDDTDIFVLLVHWTSSMRVVAKIQMERWNGDVLDINETVQRLGPRKFSQLIGVIMTACSTKKTLPYGHRTLRLKT